MKETPAAIMNKIFKELQKLEFKFYLKNADYEQKVKIKKIAEKAGSMVDE